jgi:hypothetical protein
VKGAVIHYDNGFCWTAYCILVILLRVLYLVVGVGHRNKKMHATYLFLGEKMLHVDTFATHQWHCLPGSYWLKP